MAVGKKNFTLLLFRFLEDKYNLIDADPMTVMKLTDCNKPCRYNKYHIIGDMHTSVANSSAFMFSLFASSNDTLVETETLMFPWTSLVAEFGGTLSLFLGVSFMTVWDKVILLGRFLKHCLASVLKLRI